MSNVRHPSRAGEESQESEGPYYNTPGWNAHCHGAARGWGRRQRDRAGRLSHGCIAWMLGLPLPIVILAFLWRGCD